jgi:hypothetical protein
VDPVAARRILRLAFGTALALWISQVFNWSISFIAPVLLSFLLAVPMPAPNLRKGITFILALVIPIWAANWLLLPFLTYQPAVGLLLLFAACFWSFYYSASGGSPVMGAFLTLGLAVVAAVGSDSIDTVLAVNWALTLNAVIAVCFLWMAHALFPDKPVEGSAPSRPPPKKPDRQTARRSAWRSSVIVLPVIIFFLFYSGSASYLVVMIKVASMGQQAENDNTRAAGKNLLMSTIIGGIGAVIMWNLMGIWPSLMLYVLLVALGGLIMGRHIFQGPGMHPMAGVWSYAFLTMLVIIAPALMDSAGGDAAGGKFFDRLAMMCWATLYAVAAVSVFDAFWRGKAPQTVVE